MKRWQPSNVARISKWVPHSNIAFFATLEWGFSMERHEPWAGGAKRNSPSRNRPNHHKRFLPCRDRVRQQIIRRRMRPTLRASKEPKKPPPLLSHLIPNRPPQHRIPFLQSVQHRPLRHGPVHVKRHLTPSLRQRSKMKWKHHADRKARARHVEVRIPS